ncbi:hypothetical protein [Burkholderia aenigmatica]|uniref:hypothetical protein n=1 Tax=Burkholderia aenigmatica TaxID=2015348 RepID=UPI00264E55D5|nr:hypothetical protein [Burkholderia aenigmatica]MDN7880967.1 hypothetical protein [Burkholderia aenigmatica]
MNIDLQPDDRIPDGFFDFPLPIERVLYEAEQPIIYLTKTKQGQEMLAYLADETAEHQYIVVAPATRSSISRLESGSVGIREALTDTWMWMVRANFADRVSEAWSVTEATIPALHLPKPGTPLLPEHRIAFSARAVGEGIALGSVPCSVIAFVANAAKSSLKAILDHTLAANAEGRPTDAQRALYDLPVRQLKFASFEVGLAAPKQDLFPNDEVLQAVDDLQAGLEWAEDTQSDDALESDDDTKTEAILRATLALTPPSHGLITSVEVSGYWLKGRRYTLTRKSRSKVASRLRQLKEEKLVLLSGRIGEIDDDKLSFTLRDVVGEMGEQRGSFSEDLLDDMRVHYFEENHVQISGVMRGGKLRVTAVVQTVEEPPVNRPAVDPANDISEI